MVICAAQPEQAVIGEWGAFAKKQYCVHRDLPPIVLDLWWGREKTPALSPGGSQETWPKQWIKIAGCKRFGVELKSRVHFYRGLGSNITVSRLYIYRRPGESTAMMQYSGNPFN
jgi:hypothetical protein